MNLGFGSVYVSSRKAKACDEGSLLIFFLWLSPAAAHPHPSCFRSGCRADQVGTRILSRVGRIFFQLTFFFLLRDRSRDWCFPFSSLAADLVNEANCKALVAELSKRETRLHVLFNNAGATWGDTFEDYPEEAWKKLFSLNVFGLFSLARACVPLLEKGATHDDPARIINVASIAGLSTSRTNNAPAYLSSKAAVLHLNGYLANQVSDKNISVNAISPGIFPSRMSRYYTDNPEIKKAVLSSIPLGLSCHSLTPLFWPFFVLTLSFLFLVPGRFGLIDDMAGLALFLSSKASAYLTGSNIVIDGGSLIGSKM